MIDKILHPKNLTKAYYKVVSNGGAAGVDKMSVKVLKAHIDMHRIAIGSSILDHTYLPSAIKGVEIPKSNDERLSL